MTDFKKYSDDALRTATEGHLLEITTYINSLRTQDFDIDAKSAAKLIINRMKLIVSQDEAKVALMYDALGLVGEAGEVADYVKKVIGHGKPFNQEYLLKELGDNLWYINRMARRMGRTLLEVAQHNIAKLKARYPEGFSHQASENRKE